MMKQTAVEWYGDALVKIYNEYMEANITHEDLLQNLLNARLQAKAMEKKHLYDFYMRGGINAIIEADENVEDYYNETFKSE